MKIAFRKGYDKGDIRNFLANSNEDIDKFLKTLPQKFYNPVINSRCLILQRLFQILEILTQKESLYSFLMIS